MQKNWKSWVLGAGQEGEQRPQTASQIIDPTDPFLTEFPGLNLDRLSSAALLGQEEQEKHKGKYLRIN